jgi:hypothetical protein
MKARNRNAAGAALRLPGLLWMAATVAVAVAP